MTMRSSFSSTTRFCALAVGALALGACAQTIQNSAESIARLERTHTERPQSEPAARALGIAYYKGNRLADARTTLAQAAAMDPNDGLAALYLGLTAEAQDDLPTARTAYTTYLKVGRTKSVRRQLQERLAILERKELAEASRAAIAREATLSSVAGSPTTVAVLPFSFTGSDTSLKPLERGFAELLTTDLSRSAKLTVVERARLQAILTELALQQSGAADSASGVRAGRILQAGSLVGGSILQNGEDLSANASVIDVSKAQVTGAPSSDQQKLEQVFTLEKNVALGLFTSLGVTLTTAERDAVEQRPTKSLAAFLAYSRGLELQDAGQYQRANDFFNDAVRLDPSFGAAQQKRSETRVEAAGTQVSSTTVEASLKGTAEGQLVVAATEGSVVSTGDLGSTVGQTISSLNPSGPEVAAGAATGGTTGPTTPPPAGEPTAAGGTGTNDPGSHGVVILKIGQPGVGHR
jgi:tetratricopeptide (TPR) repeat protein